MIDDTSITAMGGVLVLECYICGNLLRLFVNTPEERAYFNRYGRSCFNQRREDVEIDPGCTGGGT